ncbi:hypothetical protein BC828DRAFT_258259 [Blastocladiella britannica]|nr:hypothetical protein BC828DRAFT_258259 [Blastocladiella britannica]
MENTSKVVHDEGTVGQTLLDGHSTPATGALAILSMSTPLPLPLPLPLPTRSENAQMSNSGQSQQDLLSCSANDNPRAFVLPGKHLPSSMLATGADSSGALRVHQRTPSDPGRISAATSMSTASTISNTADYHISTLPALSPEHIAAIRSSFISSGVVHGCDPADDQQDVIHVVATDGRNAISRHNADQNPPRVAPQVASRVALTVPEPSIPKLKLSTTSMVSLRSLHIVEPVEAVGPLPPPAGLFKRLANPFNAWRQHVFSEPQHWFWSLYDIVVRIVDFFHFMAFPAQVAYICDVGTTFIPLYIVCDIILWLSLFLGVRRPQRDRFGQLVVGAEAKRLFYTAKLSTRFEVLSLLPLDWIVYVVATWNKAPELTCTNPTYVYGDGLPQSRIPLDSDIPWLLQLYVYSRLLRAMHLYRSLKWGIDLRIPKLVDPISRLVKTLTFTVVFSHVDSCLFWIMSTYLPSNDRWINNARILTESNGEIRSLGESFTRNLYHAERALFFVPRDTGNFAEIVYQIIEMLYAAVLYGSIFGNMSSIVRSLDNSAGLDKAAKQRKFKKLSLEQYMKEYKFPPDLQTKVLQQEEFDWAHKKGVNTDDLFKFLPQSIREQVNYHLYHNLIASVPILTMRTKSSSAPCAKRSASSTLHPISISAKRVSVERKCTSFERARLRS